MLWTHTSMTFISLPTRTVSTWSARLSSKPGGIVPYFPSLIESRISQKLSLASMGITAQGTKQRLLITTVTKTRCLPEAIFDKKCWASSPLKLNFKLYVTLNFEFFGFLMRAVTINSKFSLYGLNTAPHNLDTIRYISGCMGYMRIQLNSSYSCHISHSMQNAKLLMMLLHTQQL